MTFDFKKFSAPGPGRKSSIAVMQVGDVVEFRGKTKQNIYQTIRYNIKKRPEREYSWAISGDVIAVRRDK